MMPRLSGEVMYYDDDDAPTVRDSLDNINERLLSIAEEIAKAARPAMRHDNPIPGPVRVMQTIGGVVTVADATALRLTDDDHGDCLTVLSHEGHAYRISMCQCWFPINGPTNEPPQWAPEVAVLGPVRA